MTSLLDNKSQWHHFSSNNTYRQQIPGRHLPEGSPNANAPQKEHTQLLSNLFLSKSQWRDISSNVQLIRRPRRCKLTPIQHQFQPILMFPLAPNVSVHCTTTIHHKKHCIATSSEHQNYFLGNAICSKTHANLKSTVSFSLDHAYTTFLIFYKLAEGRKKHSCRYGQLQFLQNRLFVLLSSQLRSRPIFQAD